ncbi:MAG: Nif3-like dinuclear metal center hexameric protein [Bacteroidetes bacterium]|nr:Nif3-like dinuclear metal center hexameric protein [Bacteroidota bacterium]
MKLNHITGLLSELAPPSLQESYDNSGLIVGDANMSITGILVSLDATEAVVDEAIAKKCNLIVAHHPIVFKGLKKINGKNYVERTIIKAIKNDVAIYAIHTNLDNVLEGGVNQKIGNKLSLNNVEILAKKSGTVLKLAVYVPKDHLQIVQSAMFQAGAGHIGDYDECSFVSEGTGSFRGGPNAKPFVGEPGERHLEPETKLEVVIPRHLQDKVINGMLAAHPYEEVAFDLHPLDNKSLHVGAGLIGTLKQPLKPQDFLAFVKNQLQATVVRFTDTDKKEISRVAVCGGSGSFLIHAAKAAGADAYVTGDVKYHEFFDGENEMMICDLGHFESEQFTIELLRDFLSEKIPNFAILFTETDTNPVNYFY